MANSKSAIEEAILRVATYRECEYLYLATHGGDDGLHLLNGEKLSRSRLQKLLVKIKQTDGSNLRSLYLGSCLFGTHELAEQMFHSEIGLKWIAGYNTEVDWLESSALDLLFFNELLKPVNETDMQKIVRVATTIDHIASGLVDRLGFGIYTRKQATGGAKNILQSKDVTST